MTLRNDSNAFGPSEQGMQAFPQYQRLDPPELDQFRRLHDSLLPHARAHGYENVFAWIGSGKAAGLTAGEVHSDAQPRFGYSISRLSQPHGPDTIGVGQHLQLVRGAPVPIQARPVPARPTPQPGGRRPNERRGSGIPLDTQIGPQPGKPQIYTPRRVGPDDDDGSYVLPLALPDLDHIPRDPSLPPAADTLDERSFQLSESLFAPLLDAGRVRNPYGRPGLPSTVEGTKVLVEECIKVIAEQYPSVKRIVIDEEFWHRPATEDGQQIYGTTKGSSYADARMWIEFRRRRAAKGLNLNTTTMRSNGEDMILREKRSFERLQHNLRAAGNEVAEWFQKFHPSLFTEEQYRRMAHDKCLDIMKKNIGRPQKSRANKKPEESKKKPKKLIVEPPERRPESLDF